MAAMVAATLLAYGARPAHAQGYHVEAVELVPSEEPESATSVEERAVVGLPFRLHLYGEPHDVVTLLGCGAVLPGEVETPEDERPPSSPMPQPIVTGPWDGVIAPTPGSELEDARYWIEGVAPNRRLVVAWNAVSGARVQVRLHERPGRVEFVHDVPIRTGGGAPTYTVSVVDERGGPRHAYPTPIDDSPDTDWRFEPRTVLVNVPDRFEEPIPVVWADVRKESVVPDGCARRCVYLARGRLFFHVPDRAREYLDPRHGRRLRPKSFIEALQEEDRVTFPTADAGERRGDERRWVRQVLDGKIQFLRAEDGEPLRVWFRVVEYFTLDARGIAGADFHTWNLRHTLSAVFPGADPRRPIDGYQAWRARARGRLTVGKLFAADQPDDAGAQFDTGRRNEYVLYAGRLCHGERERLAPAEVPGDGWVAFALTEDDEPVRQYIDGPGLRFVADPNHVDGHYDYVIGSETDDEGWIFGADRPSAPHHDEPFEVGIARPSGPETGR